MSSSTKIQIRCFGVFRDFFKDRSLNLDVLPESTVSDLKTQIGKLILELNPEIERSGQDIESLISRSVLADETRVLSLSEILRPGMALAILPPVCGG